MTRALSQRQTADRGWEGLAEEHGSKIPKGEKTTAAHPPNHRDAPRQVIREVNTEVNVPLSKAAAVMGYIRLIAHHAEVSSANVSAIHNPD